MHWLAYWNDCKSVKYLLDIVEKNVTTDSLNKLMQLTYNGMTPIDIAGRSDSPEVAKGILDYFTERFKFVEMIFN
jgi:hypothetical protein